jgi:hypothetical protein
VSQDGFHETGSEESIDYTIFLGSARLGSNAAARRQVSFAATVMFTKPADF